MICPKCQNAMSTFDKKGVHLEQCQGCHGIFLDRGELERILSAESAFHSAHNAPPQYQAQEAPAPPPRPQAPYGHAPQGYPPQPPPPQQPPPHAHGPYGHAAHGHGPHGYPDSPRPYQVHYPDSPRPYYGYHHKSFVQELFD